MHPQTIFHQRPSLLRPNCILGDRRVRSEQYAWFPFVEPGPSKSFDRGRLKVSVPAQFQRNSRSEGPGPRRGKSSLCQCALRQKKADTDYPRSRGTHAPGVWSCICDSFRRSLGNRVGSQRFSSSRTGGCPTRRTHAPDARHWHAGGGQRAYMRAHEDGSESQSRFLPEKTKTAREPSGPCCAEHA